MTSVVGILNKRGVALAADSAVTIKIDNTSSKGEKCTKNGNKMIRLNNVVPICVMVTGIADFLCNPWDVVIRRYRQERGDIAQPTVEAAIADLFDYISKNFMFWDVEVVNTHVRHEVENLFDWVIRECYKENERKEDGTLQRPAAFKKAFLKAIKKISDRQLKAGICPQFESYTVAEFHKSYGTLVETFLQSKAYDENTFWPNDSFPSDILEDVQEEFEKSAMTMLTTCDHSGAELIFSGFGEEEEYPSLIPVWVYEGLDFRVNYCVESKEVVHISDEKPVAICPFAQKDVTKAILRGIHTNWSENACNELFSMFDIFCNEMFAAKEGFPEVEMDTLWDISDVKTDDLRRIFQNGGLRLLDANQREWEKNLAKYDLKSMASLAESLIELTGFHRILNFEQEGVGGPVDLATISKVDGFSWLNRKSWYHHKDTDGMHGRFGI